MFDIRHRTQIQAALEFWVAIGTSSRTHPSEHPQVKVFFESGTLPLTNDEIRNLIFIMRHSDANVTTIPQFAAHLPGISEYQLRKEVRNLKILPIIRGTSVYELSALLPAVRKIRWAEL